MCNRQSRLCIALGETLWNRIWLKNYPPGCRSKIDPSRYASLPALFARKLSGNIQNNVAFNRHGQGHYLCRDRCELIARVRRVPCRTRAEAGRTRRRDDAQHACPTRISLVAILRAGFTVVNVDPLYTPRELEFQLNDCGAEAIVVLENLPPRCSRLSRAPDQAHRRASSRRSARHAEGRHRQSRRAPREETLAGLRCRKRQRFMAAHRGRASPDIHAAQKQNRRTSPACNIPAARPASPRAPCFTHRNLIANMLQAAAWLQPEKHTGKGSDHHHRGAAALSHLLVHGRLPADDADRRDDGPHSQPARSARPHREAVETSAGGFSGRQHAVQRPDEPSRLRQDRLEPTRLRGRRRHGRAEGGGRALVQDGGEADHRSLWLVRDIAGAHRQPHRHYRMDRHDRLPVSVDGDFDPRRAAQRGTARHAG